ncbi:MAG: hypothetical protein OXJ55_01995 [Caldilineaceae bacterium]|nr:hypothetical protein [Caldilineaceae bacterium]
MTTLASFRQEYDQKINDVEKSVVEISKDLEWIKWILKVVAPAVILQLLASITQIVIAVVS